MTDLEKALDIGAKAYPDEENIWARGNVEKYIVRDACMEMAKYKDEKQARLIDAICEWFGNYLMEIGYPDDWMRDSPNTLNGEQRLRKFVDKFIEVDEFLETYEK